MGGLFKTPKPSVIQYQQPFQSTTNTATDTDSYTDTAQSTVGQNVGSTATNIGTTGTTGTTEQNRRLTGLQDQTLLDPLKTALSGTSLTTPANQGVADLVTARLAETTPAGYESARQKAVEDYAAATNAIGHTGASLGLAGDFNERNQAIADEALASELFNAYDEGQVARDQNLLGLSAGSNALDFDRLNRYAGILQQTPFTRTEEGTGSRDTKAQEDSKVRTLESLTELLSSLGSRDTVQKIRSKSDTSGYTTGTHIQNRQSPLQQLVGLAANAGKAYAGFGF